MHRVALVIALLVAFIAPAFAQKANIEAVTAKWVESCYRGDVEGIA
jgi:hypothetical protein